MSEPISVDSLPPAVKRVLAHREHHAELQHEANALDQRWPISVNVRSVVVNLALEMSGLVVDPEGTVSPMVPTDEESAPQAPNPARRDADSGDLRQARTRTAQDRARPGSLEHRRRRHAHTGPDPELDADASRSCG